MDELKLMNYVAAEIFGHTYSKRYKAKAQAWIKAHPEEVALVKEVWEELQRPPLEVA